MATKTEIDAEQPVGDTSNVMLARRMQAWYEANGRLEDAKRLRETPDNDLAAEFPNLGISQAGMAVWQDRFEQIESKTPSRTIGQAANQFLSHKRQQAQSNERSIGRWGNLQRNVRHFVEFAGGHAPITKLDSQMLVGYYAQLQDELWSASYTADVWAASKQFIRWCWQTDLIMSLPRIIDSKDFVFKRPLKTINLFGIDELRTLLHHASDLTKLYLLIMMNCGYTQKDISDLKPDQVDWVEGRIRRKRSKTEDNKNVPEVNYKLWDRTFELLQQFGRQHGERVLLNANGKPLKTEFIKDGRDSKVDCIRLAYGRVCKKLGIVKPKPLKLIRKTSATMIDNQFKGYGSYFLGHAPRSTAERYYVVPNQQEFDEAVQKLGDPYGV